MCGITGFVNYKKDISSFRNVLADMNEAIAKRGPDEQGYYISENVALAHKRLIVIDPEGGKQPMSFHLGDTDYIIVYNGQIYNTQEIKEDLLKHGFTFESHSDTEVLLKAFVQYGKDVVNHLNGIFAFAIWNCKTMELFLARDHFGVKPLFYTIFEDTLIFASEIKSIFKYPEIEKIVDKQGICELFGIGPAHTPGTTVFKNIFELKPAHFAIFNESGIHTQKYWSLESKPHTDDFETTCDKLEFLLKDSITKQLVSDVPLCIFLSGGLDSSLIAKFASDYCYENGLPPLNTFSIDYVDNDKNFKKSDFQPNSDNYYIQIMRDFLYCKHKNIVIDTPELADYLTDAMIARDMPGMADIDSSLLLFCKNVKENATVSLTGECADEIFGGYPWFFREDALNSKTFPWSIAISERQNLLNPSISSKVDLKDYIDFRYGESLSEVQILDSDSPETAEKRKISHLTLNWFMQTLLDRSDRMAMYNGFELRVPFCDYRLAEYVWNIPWEIKALNGREKGLLRHIAKKFLPAEIVDRKKSPYPKTHNPTYLTKVKSMLSSVMDDSSAPINNLLNRNYILDILNSDGTAFSRPWFGQLMTGPQLMAYLYQVNKWLEMYEPKFEV
ncbi:MAG: asparagine synthase (glutamine-hydrolyzing) [Clostridia bacterium]|nr:asparagine synthase (glutamine-hydrolyzing) [Clostridia bacterium]